MVQASKDVAKIKGKRKKRKKQSKWTPKEPYRYLIQRDDRNEFVISFSDPEKSLWMVLCVMLAFSCGRIRMTDTRLWRCPECLQTFRIRADMPDPDLCKNCSRVASEEKQSRSTHQHEPPASPIFDNKKKSFLSSDLSLKKISLVICIPFFFCCFGMVLIGTIINVFTSDESKQVREIAPQTTFTEKKKRNLEQPQTYSNRIPIVSKLTEKERKVIYRAIMFAFESATRDPEWKRLDNRINNGAQNGESPNDLGKMVDRQNEIDGRYLQTYVWGPFGITEKEQITIYYEGIKKRW